MTRKVETLWISIAVTAVMGTMFVMYGIWSANSFTKNYVEEKIQVYDSTVTKIRQAQYDTIITRLNEIKLQNNE